MPRDAFMRQWVKSSLVQALIIFMWCQTISRINADLLTIETIRIKTTVFIEAICHGHLIVPSGSELIEADKWVTHVKWLFVITVVTAMEFDTLKRGRQQQRLVDEFTVILVLQEILCYLKIYAKHITMTS